MSVDWPSRDRAIPYTSNSLDVTVTKGGQAVAHKIVNRPAGVAPHSDVELSGLPSGSLQATIKAYPETGTVGTPQASGVVTFEASTSPGSTIPVSLTTTVASLSITASEEPSIGTSVLLSLAARDANGKTVLLRYGGYQELVSWSSSSLGVATLQPDGTSAVLQGLSDGETTVTATFSPEGETPITAQKSLTIQSASGTVVIR